MIFNNFIPCFNLLDIADTALNTNYLINQPKIQTCLYMAKIFPKWRKQYSINQYNQSHTFYFHSLILQHMSEVLALFNDPHDVQKAVSSEETFTPTVISLIVICCLLIVGTIILIIYIQQTTKKYVI